ncbi:MAG: hypothetical protein GY851_32445 [bacterium]|nr:hypothetical protein [bacterium]
MQRLIVLTLVASIGWIGGAQEPAEFRDLMSDTWVATDALGRALPGDRDCPGPRDGKQVGIFYFLWLGEHGTAGPFDLTKLLAERPHDPRWGPEGTFHHWGEPELGYYLSTDEYVIRKHCSMLNDAGVDVVFFDVTNGFTYEHGYITLCYVFNQIRESGQRTPQIGFLTHSSGDKVITRLYNEFYSKNVFPDLWFRWDGKPLILGKPDGVPPEVADFFTFRESWAWSGSGWFGDGKDKWPWLDHYPQKPGWHEEGVPEQVPVAAAQHPTTNIGRSFHDGKQPAPDAFRTDEGLCFADQWRRALEVDPQFVFITGWNEWVAQRFISKGKQKLCGEVVPEGGTFFVDQFTREYSRDLEPMKGGHTDSYYYQMVGNIRRYKGVRTPPPASAPRTIAIDGAFEDWEGVAPEFRDTVGDTMHRDYRGWGAAGQYVDTTGRNDFVTLKVTHDERFVYFLAETQEPITSCTDPKWMLLFIDSDQTHDTGWEGYDFVVNRNVVDEGSSSVQKTSGTHQWPVAGTASFSVSGTRMELAVARETIGLEAGKLVAFDFHWADNIQKYGDIVEFGIHGDSAPNRRFNYRYTGVADR